MADFRSKSWWKYVTAAWITVMIVAPGSAYALQHVR